MGCVGPSPMNDLVPVAILAAAFVLSLVGTGLVRRHAVAARILDEPNHRSSHTVATPRGGGVAIALSTVASALLLWLLGRLPHGPTLGLAVGGALVAWVGWVDDRRPVAAGVRLLVQLAAATLAVLLLHGAAPPIAVGGTAAAWLIAGTAVLGLAWMINLFNFMDGIDGIASIEAALVCGGGALLAALAGHDGMVLPPLLVAAATIGFIPWNFPRARIFLGDSGSGFLGFAVGLLAIQAAMVDWPLFIGWMVLSGVFVVDASFTLARRLLRGEAILQGHRSHAYQRAARRAGSHAPVTIAVAAIGLLLLLPLAAGCALGAIPWAMALAGGYLPLLIAAVLLGAGGAEPGP